MLRNVIADTDTDYQCGNLITRIALAVAPFDEGDTQIEQVAAKQDFAAQHLANIEKFLDGHLSLPELEQGAKLLLGLTRLLQARNSHIAKKRMAEWMCTSIDSGAAKFSSCLKAASNPTRCCLLSLPASPPLPARF